jgi:hypothetical protein
MPLIAPPDLIVRAAGTATRGAAPPGSSTTGSSTTGSSTTREQGFKALVAEAKSGIAILRGNCSMDRQQRSGLISGALYEIRNGQLGRYLGSTAVLDVRSLQFLQNIAALGDASSATWRGFTSTKGQPEQEVSHGVLAVPMLVRDVVLRNAVG